MTYTARAVAEWVLWLAAQKGRKLSPMQLQKLLYYAQGYSLGMTGEALFGDAIEAWTHGPVVPDVYRLYKRYAGNIITPPGNAEIPDEILGIIDVVVSEKSELSAAILRNDTHDEDPYKTTNQGEEITTQELEAFFVDKFWTSDEEDEYEPIFDTKEEEIRFFQESVSDEKKRALLNASSK